MAKSPRVVAFMAVLAACQTSCNKLQKDVNCLCPVPSAQLTIAGGDGVNVNAIDVDPKPTGWSCYQKEKQANCSFQSLETQASFTLSVNGYKPQAIRLEITEGKEDTVCACGWMKADPSVVELEKSTKD